MHATLRIGNANVMASGSGLQRGFRLSGLLIYQLTAAGGSRREAESSPRWPKAGGCKCRWAKPSGRLASWHGSPIPLRRRLDGCGCALKSAPE